jgi:hypothetical protein
MKKRYIQAPILLGSPSKDSYIYHKIMKLVDILKEIKVLSPSPFKVKVYLHDDAAEDEDGYWIDYNAESYFNNILLDDNTIVNNKEGHIIIDIPSEIYNTIKNQLPPHKVIAPRVRFVRIKIEGLKNINIVYKEGQLQEIKVNTPGLVSTLKNYQRQILSTKDADFKKQLVLKGAELVLPIFEKKYPNDDRPRKAIETAKAYLLNPTEENEEIARDASDSTAYSWDFGRDTNGWHAAYAAIYANEFILDDEYDDTYARSSIFNAVAAAEMGDGIPVDEIKVLSPTPKFTGNEQLSLYLKEHPKFRGTLVDEIVKDIDSKPYPHLTDQQWLDIIQDWKTRPEGLQYKQYVDEITLYSELGVNLYLSLDPMDFQDGAIVFGTNTFNYEYTVV